MKLTRVVVARPNESSVLGELEGDVFKRCQEIVGGYVQIVQLLESGDGWCLVAYVNEDGIAQGLPFNMRLENHLLYGPIVIVRERVDAYGQSEYGDIWGWQQSRVTLAKPLGAVLCRELNGTVEKLIGVKPDPPETK